MPQSINTAVFQSCTASKKYNGKTQKPVTVVKLGKTTLKAGRDYDIYYNGSMTDLPLNKGSYIITICGKGNYAGWVCSPGTATNASKIFTIK